VDPGGARRELAQSLAEGLAEHVSGVRRRVPGASAVLVQVDEPALSAVLSGSVPTASGFHRHRAVDAPAAAPALEWVLDAIRTAGGSPIVHSCSADVPFDLLTKAGAPGLSVDLDQLGPEGYDAVAAALEAGRRVLLGVVPATRPATVPSESKVTERVLRFLDMLGLSPSPELGLTPACGLAGADPEWVRIALSRCRAAAANLS
jgi:methionine synthase II (cobalamin-independent)